MKKYAIVIPDGCADEPLEELGGRTPLQAAHTPHLDRLARQGAVGMATHVPESLPAGSDVATLSLVGYDPARYYTGRAPLEAAALGVALGPRDWAFRCNLVAVGDGRMLDFSAGHIPSPEAHQLIAALQQHYGSRQIRFVPGVSYRHLMVYRPGEGAAPFGPDLVTTPPHDITGRPIDDYRPSGTGADVLQELMVGSRRLLEDHAVNVARRQRGEPAANMCWLWGQGQAPALPAFTQVYGVRGAFVCAVDLIRGLGTLLGWDRIAVPGATGYFDTDYAAKGRAAIQALADHDLVCVHIEAPDEAGHEGNIPAKIAALERIDAEVIGPLVESLGAYPWHRILVSPDHPTPIRVRTHVHGPVPFVISGSDVQGPGGEAYTEAQAARSGLAFPRGHELMRFFLKG